MFQLSGLYPREPVRGWLPKLWCPFGSPKYSVPYYSMDPKKDHNFDNNPCPCVGHCMFLFVALATDGCGGFCQEVR